MKPALYILALLSLLSCAAQAPGIRWDDLDYSSVRNLPEATPYDYVNK